MIQCFLVNIGLDARILLAEDNADFRSSFASALEEVLIPEGLEVVFVEVGTLTEARARLREGGLDAALIDVGMPDGDGLDLVREIHDGGMGRPIPTMVLTASLDTNMAIRAMELGGRGALSKLASMPEATETIKVLTQARPS